jgi:hypothetical protein
LEADDCEDFFGEVEEAVLVDLGFCWKILLGFFSFLRVFSRSWAF